MEWEEEPEPSSTPKLPLLSIPTMQSPERSGMRTPPLHTSASVPFRWEEEPGKPRPCAALVTTLSNPNTATTRSNKCLELPPRMQSMDAKMTKMPSPTTVLEGPYVGNMPMFRSSSFRFRRERRQGSFGSSCGSPERRGQLGSMVLSKKLVESKGSRGIFGCWRKKPTLIKRGKKEIDDEGSLVFLSSMDMDLADSGVDESGSTKVKKMSRIGSRGGSFSSLSHQVRSHFWETIYKGFKQVLPWKSRKSRKDGLII